MSLNEIDTYKFSLTIHIMFMLRNYNCFDWKFYLYSRALKLYLFKISKMCIISFFSMHHFKQIYSRLYYKHFILIQCQSRSKMTKCEMCLSNFMNRML